MLVCLSAADAGAGNISMVTFSVVISTRVNLTSVGSPHVNGRWFFGIATVDVSMENVRSLQTLLLAQTNLTLLTAWLLLLMLLRSSFRPAGSTPKLSCCWLAPCLALLHWPTLALLCSCAGTTPLYPWELLPLLGASLTFPPTTLARFRTERVMIRTSPLFNLIILIGGFITSLSAVLYVVLPSDTNGVCQLRVAVPTLAVTTMLASLFMKTYRIARYVRMCVL